MSDRTRGAEAGITDKVFDVQVRGRQLRVAIRRGDGSGPARTPLLLMNGIGAAIDVLQPFVDQLPPELEVIRFDAPGVGGSPLPAAPYHMTTLAPVVGELVRKLGYDVVDVLGFSWGGGLAQQFAISEPELCRRLVLVATGTGMLMVTGRPSVLLKMITPRRHRDAGYTRQVAAELYGGSVRTHPELAEAVLHPSPQRTSERAYLYQLLAGLGWSTLPVLGLIRQPTLIVAGDDDPIIPSVNGTIMHRGIPGSRLHSYHGGHLALLTEAAQLAPVIDDFLTAAVPRRVRPPCALGRR